MTRTDIHRPSAPEFDPQAYSLVDVFDLHPESGDHADLNREIAELGKRGIVQAPHSLGCGHCGQTNVRYVALLVHEDASEWIFVGQDCLVARFSGITKARFAELRKAAELARAKQEKKKAWLAFCDANPAMAWASYAVNIEIGIERELKQFQGQQPLRDAKYLGTTAHDHYLASGLSWGINTMADIARKTRSYGDASDKQVALVERIAAEQEAKVAEYVTKMAARAAQPQATLVVTGKRQLVEGTVVSRKDQDDPYSYSGGVIWKILVEQADGSRVWGTEPGAVETAKGDQVRFSAAVSVSDADPGFGFFKRPTQFEVLSTATAEAVAV